MGRIDSLFGANRLTFRGETTRGEQVIGAKRPGFVWVNNQVEPASVQPTKKLLEESVATTDFIKVEI